MSGSQGFFSMPPPVPVKGNEVIGYIKRFNYWIRQNRIIPGVGLTAQQTSSGIALNVLPVINENDFLWKLTKSGTALDIEMSDGIYSSLSTSTLLPFDSVATTSDITVSNNATTKIWGKFTVAGSASGIYVMYPVTAYAIESGASVPDNTFDITTNTDGFVYQEIGSVVASGGVVTGITQTLKTLLNLAFPYMIGNGTEGDVLVMGSSVAEWETPGAC